MSGFNLTLSKPIKINGKTGIEDLAVLTLREPNGGNLLDFGEPTTVERTMSGNRLLGENYAVSMKVTRNMSVCRQYLVRLSGHDGSTIGALAARDMLAAINWLTDVALAEGDAGPLAQPPSAS